MEDGNLAVLVDAKTEYTKQLINILKYNLFLSITNFFKEAKKYCDEQKTYDMVLNKFQELLSEIPNWNQDIINKEYESIIETSKCDWLDELITAVFVSHTRILTSINFNKKKNKINLKIPKTTHFIHKCFIDVARYFWKNAYLFDDRVNNYERQKNRRETETIIELSINETIRKELPVKHILKEYLGNDYKEDENTFDENISTKNNLNLRNMVIKEIKNCTNEQLDLIQSSIKEDNNKHTEILDNSQSFNNNTTKEQLKINDPLQTENLPIPVKVTVETPEPLVESVQIVESPKQVTVETPEPLVESVQIVESPKQVTVETQKPVVDSVKMIKTPNSLVESNELKFDTLKLDDMDDLSKLEEIYLDPLNSISNNSISNNSISNNSISNNSISNNSISNNIKVSEEHKTDTNTDEQINSNNEELNTDVKTIIINTNKINNSVEQKSESNSQIPDEIKNDIIKKYKTNKEFSFF
jgi:hypothetical protein